MRIDVQQLQQEPILFDRQFAPGEIAYGDEGEQVTPLAVNGRADLVEEHHGPKQIIYDIRVRAEYSGDFNLPCARCLEPVEQHLEGTFDLLYRPLGVDAGADEHSISTSETEIGYYQGDGLELEDVLREQVLLSLPARALCSEGCKGLCPQCGQNLNTAACSCDSTPRDPRWQALAGLRTQVKG